LSAVFTDAFGWVRSTWDRLCALPDQLLFGPASRQAGMTARLRRAARYPYALLRDLIDGRLNLHATGLVYASLLSIIPLLALSFGVLATFHAQDVLRPLVHDFFAPMGSASNTLTDRVMDYARNVHGGLVSSLGLGVLVWTLIGTLRKVEDGFNFAWRIEVPRNFARRGADYLTLLVVGPLLLVVVAGFSRLAADSTRLRVITELPLLDRLTDSALRVAPYALVSVLLTALYIAIPNTRVRLRPALIGGVTAGILWAAVGRYFSEFVLYSARLTLVYAGFAIMIAALLWTYFGWTILLLGARLSFYAQNPGYLREGLSEPRLSGADIERLALGVMYLIAERARDRRPPWSVSELAMRLEYPDAAVARICRGLAAADYLATASDGTLQLARDAAAIRPIDIVLSARVQSSRPSYGSPTMPAAVESFCEQLDRTRAQQFASMTLRELIDAPSPSPSPSPR
jgi:membrane protein